MSQLIGGTLAAGQRREFWQDSLMTLGLFLVALGLPTLRLIGDGPALVQATDRGAWFSTHLLLQPLAQLLSRLPSIGAETAWFLIAGLCWAATYPVLTRTSLALGIPRLASCIGALLVLASPLGFLSATVPGPSAPALLGSAILFSSLITSWSREKEGRRELRPLGIWFAVCLLDPNLVLLLPAVVWKCLADPGAAGSPRPARGRILLGASVGLLALAILVTLAGAGLSTGDVPSVWRGLGSRLLGIGSIGAPDSLTFLFVIAPSLGVGILGIAELLRRPAEPTDSAPPAWIAAFAAVPLGFKLLGGTPGLDTGAWVLGPMIALGLAAFVSRVQEGPYRSSIFYLCVAQIAFSVAFRFTIEAGDPNSTWKANATEMLEPSDLVVTRDQQHDYLLRNRYHVGVINLRIPVELGERDRSDWWADARGRVRAQARAGGRVVVDWKVGEPTGGNRGYPYQQELRELVLLAPVIHLDPRGEKLDRLEEFPVPALIEDL